MWTAVWFRRGNQWGGFVQIFQAGLEQSLVRDAEQFPELARGEVDGAFELAGKMALVKKTATGSDFADPQGCGGEELFGLGKANFRE